MASSVGCMASGEALACTAGCAHAPVSYASTRSAGQSMRRYRRPSLGQAAQWRAGGSGGQGWLGIQTHAERLPARGSQSGPEAAQRCGAPAGLPSLPAKASQPATHLK